MTSQKVLLLELLLCNTYIQYILCVVRTYIHLLCLSTFMQINDYAQGRTFLDTNHLGYVQRGCGKTVEETQMIPILYPGKKTVEIKYIYINLLVGGILFQAILICLGTALLLQRWLPAITRQSLHCYKMHSMLWAVVTTTIIAWIIIMSVNTHAILSMYWHGHYVITATSAVLVYIPSILELPVAVYFARKYSFAIPCVYLAPVRLLCCRRQSRAALLVRVMSLWLLLAVIQLACANGTFIVIAIAATPFPVISNVLVILFTFFCLFHLFAVIFNLPHLQRRKSNINKPSEVKFGIALLQGIALFFFLVTLACYVMAGAGFSYIINTQRNRGVVLELDKVILPAALGITGFGLRMLSKMWWSTIAAGSSEGEEEEQSLMTANDGREPA